MIDFDPLTRRNFHNGVPYEKRTVNNTSEVISYSTDVEGQPTLEDIVAAGKVLVNELTTFEPPIIASLEDLTFWTGNGPTENNTLTATYHNTGEPTVRMPEPYMGQGWSPSPELILAQ